MIRFKQSGDFRKVTRWLERVKEMFDSGLLNKYGEMGVKALADATPKDSGKTASSWYYDISNVDGVATIEFGNSNINNGVPIAVIIQYGHGTGTGGYVQGIDYINPALKPIFEGIVNDVCKEVRRA